MHVGMPCKHFAGRRLVGTCRPAGPMSLRCAGPLLQLAAEIPTLFASCPVSGRSALLLSAFAPVLFLYKNKKIKKYARQKVSICAVDKLCQ